MGLIQLEVDNPTSATRDTLPILQHLIRMSMVILIFLDILTAHYRPNQNPYIFFTRGAFPLPNLDAELHILVDK
jgi:hypothetical protein